MVRLLFVFATVALAGCWRHHERTEVVRVDAGPREIDAGVVIVPEVDAGGCGSRDEVVMEFGECFELRTCCADVDCNPGWECSERGYCEDPERLCFCASDPDCPVGAVCRNNEIWCGLCQLACNTDADCDSFTRCIDGSCAGERDRCIRYEDWDF